MGGPRHEPFEVPRVLDRAAALSWRFLVVAAAVFVVVKALVELRIVVLPLIVALFASTVLVPPARWLRSHRWPPSLAAMAVMLLTLAMLVGGSILFGTAVADEFGGIGEVLEEGVDDFRVWLSEGPVGMTPEDVDRWASSIGDRLSGSSETVAQELVAAGTLLFEVVAGLILAFVITFFIVKDGTGFGPWITGSLPDRYGSDLAELGVRTWATLVGYLRGVAITGLVDALFIGLGLVILGVPLALPLAVLTFFGAFVPLVGATVGGALAALVALVTSGLPTALAVVALTVAVQQVESHILAPLVLGRAVRLHPVTILLALTAGVAVAGIVGAFLSVPLAALTKTFLEFYRGRPQPVAATLPSIISRPASSGQDGEPDLN